MRVAASGLVALAMGAIGLLACRTGRDSAATSKAGQESDLLYPRAGGGGLWLPPEARREASGTRLRTWDWNGIVGTGQSLAVGAQSGGLTLTTQPFHNLKLSLGRESIGMPPYDPDDSALSVIPLVEPVRPVATGYPGAYPLNIYGETPHTAMADQLSSLCASDTHGECVSVHSVVGESGQGMHVINKTANVSATRGHAYAATLFEVAALKRLAAAAGKTYGVGAVVLTHGETDAHSVRYESDVVQLQRDYNTDIVAITGQSGRIPLLFTQQQTSPADGSTPASLVAQWKLGADHPGDVVCVGPKYQYPYAPDHVHLLASGYDRLGEKYGEVYYETVVLGKDWQPLQPMAVHRTGREIAVTFHVPTPPLVWDEALPSPHQTAHIPWSRGRGFEVDSRNGESTIASVAIHGNSVVITLADDPATTDLVVRYAVTQDGDGAFGGLAKGRIGQLRDSDPLIGFATRTPQYNYAVSFVAPVN